MGLNEMEKEINRLKQTIYGDNGSTGLRGQFFEMTKKVDKIDTKITLAGGVIIGLQAAMVIAMFLFQYLIK